MKIIRKTLITTGLSCIMLCTSAFATEIEIANDLNLQEDVIIEVVKIDEIKAKQEATAKKGMINVDVLNIRSGPSTDTEKIGSLLLGSTIEILSENEGWYEINFESKTAYIFSEYVSVIDSTLYESMAPGLDIVQYAKKFIGTPYAYGGNTPSGFDCSGFVNYVMKNFGIIMPRTSHDQYSIGVRVDKSQLMPGDLVFFKYNPYSYRLSHVGIYVGEGNFIHSPVPGQAVKISSLSTGYFSNYYYGATRVL